MWSPDEVCIQVLFSSFFDRLSSTRSIPLISTNKQLGKDSKPRKHIAILYTIYIFINIVSDLRIHLICGHDGLQRGWNQPLCGSICQQHISITSPLPKLQPACSCCESYYFYFLSQCHRPRRMISITSICVVSLGMVFRGWFATLLWWLSLYIIWGG
jgi:hypothetical protein